MYLHGGARSRPRRNGWRWLVLGSSVVVVLILLAHLVRGRSPERGASSSVAVSEAGTRIGTVPTSARASGAAKAPPPPAGVTVPAGFTNSSASGVGGSGPSASAVNMPSRGAHAVPDPTEVFANAEVLREERAAPDAGGRVRRLRLVRADFKYPLIRLEQDLVADPHTGEEKIVRQSAMVADHILVKVKDGVTEAELSAFTARDGARIRKKMYTPGLYLIEFPASDLDTVPTKTAEYASTTSLFACAEPDYVVYAEDVMPDDMWFIEQWGLHNTGRDGGTIGADIGALEAWELVHVANPVVVAVIDTGVDYVHPDLAAAMWTNSGEVPSNGVDDDGNGLVDDIYGWDFCNDDNDPADDYGHGTHCAGIIAATRNNGEGLAGVCASARIMSLKFLSSQGWGCDSDAVDALSYAIQMHRRGVAVRLTSNSWGGGGPGYALSQAILESGAEGMLFIAAAGNSGTDNDRAPHFPASYSADNIVAVAATDNRDKRAFFSCYGLHDVDLGAPGVDILSCVPDGDYKSMMGTSMAAPHVAGAAAMAWSVAPLASYTEVRDAIFAGVDPCADLQGRSVTGGRLSLPGMLESLGLLVVGSSPAEGEIVTTPPTDFIVMFSADYDVASVEASDLAVNGVPADSFALEGERSVVFHFNVSPVTAQGVQEMHVAAGAMQRAGDGRDLCAWAGIFRYDTVALSVVASIPSAGSTLTLPFSRLQLDFSEPFDPATVSADDLVLSTGTVAGVTILDADSIEFLVSGVSDPGEYALVANLPAGALADLYGNPSLAYEGHLLVDPGLVAIPVDLAPVEPLGSLIYDRRMMGTVSYAGDEDVHVLELDAGQTLSVVVSAEGAELQPEVEVEGPLGALGSVTAGAPGEPALLQGMAVAGDGVYIVRVRGAGATIGGYVLELLLNAEAESEGCGGGPNDVAAAAMDLDAGMIALGTGVRHGAVVGDILGTDTSDWYRVSLTAGDWLSAVAKADAEGQVSLALHDGAANLMALGAPGAANVDESVDQIRIPADGTYYLHVTGDGGRYALLVLANAAFDLESNQRRTPQDISAGVSVLGYVRGGPDKPQFAQMALVSDESGHYFDVSPGDIDGDHSVDLVASLCYRHMLVWLENPDGNAVSWVMHAIPYQFYTAGPVEAADMDGDGDLDVLAAGNYHGRMSWFENTDGGGERWIEHEIGGECMASTICAADLDGDGDLDAVRADCGEEKVVTWWENPGEEGDTWRRHAVGTGFGACVADIDADGAADILGYGYNGLCWWANAERDASVWVKREISRNATVLPQAADVDGDGRLDVVGSVASSVVWWRNVDGLGASWSERPIGDVGDVKTLSVGDIDNDGDADVAACSADAVVWFENLDGNGGSWTAHQAATGLTSARTVCLADLDGDGEQDLLAALWEPSAIKWWRNDMAHDDFFRIAAGSGDSLVLGTTTPSGGPLQFLNALDPMLELYDAGGQLVASDDNSADGVNARLIHTALGAGGYTIRALGAGASAGEYLLTVEGATGPPAPFRVNAVDPPDGARRSAALTQLRFVFDAAVLATSLQASDFVVSGLPATSCSLLDGRTVLVGLPPLGEGVQHVVVAAGSIASVRGTPVEAFVSEFTLDYTPPQVTACTLSEGDVVPVGDLTITLHFSESLTATNLDASDFLLNGAWSGPRAPASFTYDPGSLALNIHYEDLADDTYDFRLLSGDGRIEDLVGYDLDGEPHGSSWPSGDGQEGGDFEVRFTADGAIEPWPGAMKPVLPMGSLVYVSTVTGRLAEATDTDAFTVALDAGQALTVVAAGATDLQVTVTAEGPTGGVLGESTASEPGGEAMLQTLVVTDAGTYTLRVSAAGAGVYRLELWLNTALESEEHGGPANDDLPLAEDVSGSALAVSGSARRMAVVGAWAGTDTSDWYRITLEEGSRVSLAAKAWHTTDTVLGLYGPGGELLAEGGGCALNLDASVDQVLVPAAGTYCVRVVGRDARYTLLVLARATFEREANSTSADAQALHAGSAGLGFLRAGSEKPSFGEDHHVADGIGACCLAAADLDGDGDDDIATATEEGLCLWSNPGDGGGAWLESPIAPAIDGLFGVGAVDIDGDGDLDLFAASAMENVILWWENVTGDGDVWARYVVASCPDLASCCSADIDGDGDVDVLAVTWQYLELGYAIWWENEDGCGGQWGKHVIVQTQDYWLRHLEAADLDGDGRVDIATASDTGGVCWYRNTTGMGTTWEKHPVTTSDRVCNLSPFELVDVDGDGDLDVAGVKESGSPEWWANENGSASLWTQHAVGTFDGATCFRSCDIDGDSDMDLVLAGSDGSCSTVVGWFENRLGEGLAWRRRDMACDGTQGAELEVADIDLDGDMDIVAATHHPYSPGDLLWWENDLRDADWYTVAAEAGDPLTIATATPADGPREFANQLDPTLDLRDPNGTLLAADDNSAPDGRNAIVSCVAPMSGLYRVCLLSGMGSGGEYVLTTDGSAADPDAGPPRVTVASVDEGTVVSAGDLTVEIRFSEPLLAAVLDPSDSPLSGVSQGEVPPVSFSYDPASSMLRIQYDALREDVYTLRLISGNGRFEDRAGHDLDGEANWPSWPSGDGVAGGDFVVHFAVETDVAAWPRPFDRWRPWGSQIYASSWHGSAEQPGDVDTYTVALDPGQSLTVVASASNGLRVAVEVESPAGAVAGASAPEVDRDAVVQTVPTADGGLHAVRVRALDGTTGGYSLSLWLNAAVELEPHFGTPNDRLVGAETLDAGLVDGVAGVRRGAVCGTWSGTDTCDWYAVSLQSGTRVSLAAAGEEGGVDQMGLFEAGGALLVAGQAGADNVDQYIDQWLVPADGTYYLRVVGRDTSYALLALVNAAFDAGDIGAIERARELFVGRAYGWADIAAASFGAAHVLAQPSGSLWSYMAVADLNGDAHEDVVAAGASRLTWWENADGAGRQWTTSDIDTDALYCVTLGAADVDADGDVDLLASEVTRQQVLLWENVDGVGGLWQRRALISDATNFPRIVLGDMDKDGAVDIVLATDHGSSHDHIAWWRNADALGGAWTEHSIVAADVAVNGMCVADMDGDGDVDLLVGSISAKIIRWWENTDGMGGDWAEHTVCTGVPACPVRVGDMDRDGDMDVAGADSDTGAVCWWENVDGGGLVWSLHSVGSFKYLRTVVAADLDGDGDMDLVATSCSAGGDKTTWWENTDGSGTNWLRHELSNDIGGPCVAQIADMDGDSDLDLVQLGGVPFFVLWRENTAAEGDYYRFSAAANDVAEIRTVTPGDGPFEFANALDPAISVYGPSGVLLASDDNSSTDGRNASMSVAVVSPGAYSLRLKRATGAGEYVLQLAGFSPTLVSIISVDDTACEWGADTGFSARLSRSGPTERALDVAFACSGSAENGSDYTSITSPLTIPAGEDNVLVSAAVLPDDLVEGTETAVLTLVENSGYALGSPSSCTLMLEDRPLHGWKFDRFTRGELDNPSVSGDDADPDRDGVVNVFEYALALNPWAADNRAFDESVLADGRLSITYTRAKRAGDVAVTPELGFDLGPSWFSGTGCVVEEVIGEDAEKETVRASSAVDPATAPVQFMRLRLTVPE